MSRPPKDAVDWAYWFLDPYGEYNERPKPYYSKATLAEFIMQCEMTAEVPVHPTGEDQ